MFATSWDSNVCDRTLALLAPKHEVVVFQQVNLVAVSKDGQQYLFVIPGSRLRRFAGIDDVLILFYYSFRTDTAVTADYLA